MSDILLQTKLGERNFSQTKLHGNKTILAMHSSYFQDKFFSGKAVEETIAVDVQYKAMLEILKIIHHNDRKCKSIPT